MIPDLNKIYCGDCCEELKKFDADFFDSVVCDPPYHLTAGKKGGTGEASVNLDSPHGRSRITTGFMGMEWDGLDVAQRPETWAKVLRVMKPGAHLLAFGGTRTYHRMACAIEDAGFEIRDQIQWLYGSGFPKSKNLDGDWSGWGTALKPANEPIVLARKPLSETTVAANVLRWGTGALNIKAARIQSGEDHAEKCASVVGCDSNRNGQCYGEWTGEREDSYDPSGRWPSNVLFDQYAAGILDGKEPDASRFFYVAKPSVDERESGADGQEKKVLAYGNQAQAEVKRGNLDHSGDSGMNTVKMRHNNHPTVKPIALMAYLIRLITPPKGIVLDPFLGSGSTSLAAIQEGHSWIGIELLESHVAIAEARIKSESEQGKLF